MTRIMLIVSFFLFALDSVARIILLGSGDRHPREISRSMDASNAIFNAAMALLIAVAIWGDA